MTYLRCIHLKEGRTSRENKNAIKLAGDDVLDLCDECMAIVRGDVISEIAKQALMQVFQAEVTQSLK